MRMPHGFPAAVCFSHRPFSSATSGKQTHPQTSANLPSRRRPRASPD